MVVKNELYAFKYVSPVSVYKIANFTSSDRLAKTILSDLPLKNNLSNFAVTYVAGNIVLTGGDCDGNYSTQTYLMDLGTYRLNWESLPALNVARNAHTSTGVNNQVYVACG